MLDEPTDLPDGARSSVIVLDDDLGLRSARALHVARSPCAGRLGGGAHGVDAAEYLAAVPGSP